MASRTDSGVNAYQNSCDFFIQLSKAGKIYPPDIVKRAFNQHFFRKRIEIQVNDVFLVEPTFDSRKHPSMRKYIYRIRFGDIKDDPITNNLYWNISTNKKRPNGLEIGSIDLQRLYEIKDVFCGKVLNFKNFSRCREENPVYERIIDSIEINKYNDNLKENITCVDVTFTSKSFLRNQIRIITYFLIKYCCGLISKETIISYLHNEKENMDKTRAPGSGLYLAEIKYEDEHFKNHRELMSQLDLGYNPFIEYSDAYIKD